MRHKSVGQEERVLEESDRPASLTNVMDSSTNSGKNVKSCAYNVEKLSAVLNIEYMNKPLVKGCSSAHEETKNGVGSDAQRVNNQFEISEVTEINKDEAAGTMDINAGDSQKKDSLTDAVAAGLESRNLVGEDGMEPLNLAGGAHFSTDAIFKTISYQISFSGTKSIELSQSSKDNPEVNAKEEKKYTFRVKASAGQNHSLSKNMKVSSISSHGSQLDPIKLHEDSSVSNHLKEKAPTRRSRKVGNLSSPPTPPGQVTPVSNPMLGGVTPIVTSNVHDVNNSTSMFHPSFTDCQHAELGAQIPMYGSLLSGMPPEEPHMIAAFGQSDDETRAWQATWHAYQERVRSQMPQPDTCGSCTPDQGNNIGSAHGNFLYGMYSPIVNHMIPIASPLWNIPTPYHGQWFTSSPVAPFSAHFPALPIIESVKLTTVKESGAPSLPVIPVGPSAGPEIHPMVSSSQPTSDPKISKRKKVDQNIKKVVTQEEIMSKVEESKVQVADAAVHAAAAVEHCEYVWSQLESQMSSGLVSDDEAMISSSAVSVAAAASVAKAAAAAAKIASNVAEQAENLGAIVKGAELASEAVSLVGKIVAIGSPLTIRELVEAGLKGFCSFPLSKLSNQEGCSDKHNTENNETVPVISESEFGLVSSSNVDQNMPLIILRMGKDDIIKEGCLVEVLKDNIKKKNRAWFAANVLTLKDGKAYVCYTEIQSNEGSGKLKEWVPLEAEGTEPPRLRIAHHLTTMRSEGNRKRNRTAFTDYAWCSGDRVDVWVQDCWCEAVVVETNKNDVTSLTVQFPAQEKTSVVRSWNVRPTLIWKDGKWIEWYSLKGSHSSEGDTPHEKRQKFGSSVLEVKPTAELSKSVNLVRPTRSGLLREQSRVVFGVPKPGKNQKFMDVNTHSVADKNNQNNMSRASKNNVKEKQVDEVKSKVIKTRKPPIPSFKTLARESKSKPSKPTDEHFSGQPNMMDVDSSNAELMKRQNNSHASENNSKTNVNEKQVDEGKPKVIRTRKPPIPSFKTLTRENKSKPSKPTDENFSGQPNMMDVDSYNTEDVNKVSTSKATGKTAAKIDVNEKSTSEVETRRSVRRIQPTSRLLEGLQSSLTVACKSKKSQQGYI
ncbi:protein SWOLLEN 1-like [Bidens hawaiensis]|uniref:protein SWOLLEN 1-like n=1 Tax=Bidens hawaiensis TaxID=980011 RepID=UPI00404A6C9A